MQSSGFLISSVKAISWRVPLQEKEESGKLLGGGLEKVESHKTKWEMRAVQRPRKVLLSGTRGSGTLKRSCIVLIASIQTFVGFSSELSFFLKKKTKQSFKKNR